MNLNELGVDVPVPLAAYLLVGINAVQRGHLVIRLGHGVKLPMARTVAPAKVMICQAPVREVRLRSTE